MIKVLVTGANGFIGNYLCKKLIKKYNYVNAIVRNLSNTTKVSNVKYFSVGEINSQTNWGNLLKNIDCIIHCAGKAHMMGRNNLIEQDIFSSVNIGGTEHLAHQAANAGVKKFIFLSSIKVNGESTYTPYLNNNDIKKSEFFTHLDKPSPQDFYGLSKFKAENILWEISKKKGLNISILRLPLVYGEGVKGNLNRLLKLVKSGIPLPFGMINNQRSMIGLDNLSDLIIRCLEHPAAVGKTFLVSDGEDLSTPELLNLIASSMGKSSRLFPIPVFVLKYIAAALNRSEEMNKIISSLKVDSLFTRETLNWLPPVSVSEGIRKMVQSSYD